MDRRRHNLIQIALIIICSLAVAIILEKIASVLSLLPTPYFSLERLLAVFLVLLSAGSLIIYRRFFITHLHWAFAVIAAPLGIAMIIMFPHATHVSQDDIVHFPSAYNFLSSEPHDTYGTQMVLLDETASTTGRSLAERDARYARINDAHTTVITSDAASNVDVQPYKTLIYLPFYLGFQISSLLHLDLTTSITIAKICNFLCYVILIFFAIKISLNFKKLFFLFGLLVTNIFYATQFSYDPTIIASITLALAAFLRMMEDRTISPKLALAFILALSWGCLAKAIYCPLFLLVLLLPNHSFDCKGRAIAYKIGSLMVMIALAATFVLPMLSGSMAGDLRGGNTSATGQISFMIEHPGRAIKTFGTYLVCSLPSQIFGQDGTYGFGEPSGTIYIYTHYVLPCVFIIEVLYLLYITFTTNSTKKLPSVLHKIFFASLYLMITLAIIGALYLSFTPVGLDKIKGVQARYFLPILPLLLLILVPSRRRSSTPSQDSYLLLAIPFICIALILLTFTARISIL